MIPQILEARVRMSDARIKRVMPADERKESEIERESGGGGDVVCCHFARISPSQFQNMSVTGTI